MSPLRTTGRPQILLPALAVAALLVLSSCGDTSSPSPTGQVAAVDTGEREALREAASTTSSTTTTTVPPSTTTTTAPPPPTTAPPKPAAPPPPPAAASAPAPPAPAPPPPPAPNANDEARALQLVNGERARAGLPPLQLNTAARSIARQWSIHQAGSGMAHNPDLGAQLDRAGVHWSRIAENVGYAGSVDGVHSMFMNSEGHRANILSSGYSEVGIGVVHSGGHAWVTMDFIGY